MSASVKPACQQGRFRLFKSRFVGWVSKVAKQSAEKTPFLSIPPGLSASRNSAGYA